MSAGSTSVATWVLKDTAGTPAESSFDIGLQADDINVESVLEPDLREVVSAAEIAPGGIYRSIVKLQIRYENQTASDNRFAQGTGWLIKPDLLVTAGHCAYDHTYMFGRASEVKAYIGYNGKASLKTPNVKFRSGKRIATTKEWVASDVNRAYDVSFIQLDSPFDEVVPILYQPTPTTGKLTIGVVGYPADMTLDHEKGAQMYKMFKEINYDLRSSTLNMLEYSISSFAGQSGSPVMIKDQNISIGVHVYGLGTKNSASVIRGSYGNIFIAYVNSFSTSLASATDVKGVKYLEDRSKPEDSFDETFTPAENFGGMFKKVAGMTAKIGGTILTGGSPFLGPIAAPIAAAAGAAIGIAGKLVNTTESSLEPAPEYKAHASRAILSEAALQTVLTMDADQFHKYKISQKMFKAYQKNKPNVGVISKKLAPALMDSAVRISTARANQAEIAAELSSAKPSSAKPSSSGYPHVAVPATPKSIIDSKGDVFAEGLQRAAQGGHHEEGFIDFLGSIAKVGMRVLPTAIDAIASTIGGGESAFEPKPNHDSIHEHIETLCHRSLMGEAALNALMDIPQEAMHEEGFFSSFVDVVKDIGSTVMRVAPSVIKTVAPLVLSAITRESDLESNKPLLGQGNYLKPPAGQGPGLKPKRSVADLLKDMPVAGLEILDDIDVDVANTNKTTLGNGTNAISAH